MSFQKIVDFVHLCRKESGKGSIKRKESAANQLGVYIKETCEDITTIEQFLCTLFPSQHPDKYMPIGLTTLAYALNHIANDRSYDKTCNPVAKGENPFDWTPNVHILCKKTADHDADLSVDAVQRAIQMMYKSVGLAKCKNLQTILEECTIDQGKLFCEIVGCALSFGFGTKHFLQCFDDPAVIQTWIMTNNLRRVAHSIFTGQCAPITVGYYISSMLARQKPFDSASDAYDMVVTACDKNKKRKVSPYLFAQLKIDGYRIQLHRDHDANRTWYYSRHNLDLGDTYFFKVLDDALTTSTGSFAKDFILDGEIIAYDTENMDFVPCSEMNTFIWMKEHRFKLIYFVFDVLYMDGISTLHMSYANRLALLSKIASPDTMTFNDHIVVPMIPGSMFKGFELCRKVYTPQDAQDYFDKAIALDLEGIMLKEPTSEWVPYDRSNMHVKVKSPPKAYDLYIVGANINRTQTVSAVLLAYKASHDQYYTMCMCGTGLTMKAKSTLTLTLAESGTWSTKGGHHVPSYLHAYGGSEKPHMYLRSPIPCKVTAHKMVNSKIYTGGKTLRFPVIREIPSLNIGIEKQSWEQKDAVPVEVGFVQASSDILKEYRIWVVRSTNESLMSELYRNILRMGGKFARDAFADDHTPVNLILVPDDKHDEEEMTIAFSDKFANIPKVTATWLRKTFLFDKVQPIADFQAQIPVM